MESHHVRKALPLNQTVEITFTPDHAEDLTYACGMDMYHGKIHVQ